MERWAWLLPLVVMAAATPAVAVAAMVPANLSAEAESNLTSIFGDNVVFGKFDLAFSVIVLLGLDKRWWRDGQWNTTKSTPPQKDDEKKGQLPSVYEYYTEGGVTAGLQAEDDHFMLNNRRLSLYSGAMHYFRVPPGLWRDRLRRLRSAGLVAVETYVPWNLHNPSRGHFDFGDGNSTWSPFLDIAGFLRMAQEEDLLVLLRPGPYICAEWEFGGMPSWLLRDPDMRVRTSYAPFKDAVRAYFKQLMPIVAPLHFTRGGPIIALQVENEYGSLGVEDKPYLQFVKEQMETAGLPGLFFTSDSPLMSSDRGALPGVLQTANLQSRPEDELNALAKLQPGKPAMVTEYWSGWFDHWTEDHHTTSLDTFTDVLRRILAYPSGVNFYMFHGGTTFGFMNGANTADTFPTYQPDVTSYDYDAPITEWGEYTTKYAAVKKLLTDFAHVPLRTPEAPETPRRRALADAELDGLLALPALLDAVPQGMRTLADDPMPMELLGAGVDGRGQSYGFLLYRRVGSGDPHDDGRVPARVGSVVRLRGRVRDCGILLVDGTRVSPPLRAKSDFAGFGYWETNDSSMSLPDMEVMREKETHVLELLVENWGRVNYGRPKDFKQNKGFLGTIELDGKQLMGWEHIPLIFDASWLAKLHGWQPVRLETTDGEEGLLATPVLFRTKVLVSDNIDTWLDMRGWGKGVVFVNGFALGRYLHLGPSHTLYWPGALQKTGVNEVMIFELFKMPTTMKLRFTEDPIL